MALSIKNSEVEQLVADLVTLTGETKTEAVRQALLDRRERLRLRRTEETRVASFLEYLEDEIWPRVPPEELGRRLRREEEEEILGFGPHEG